MRTDRDPVEPPHGFRTIQAANLAEWTGDLHAPEFLGLRSGIIRATGGAKSRKAKRPARVQQIRYWIERLPQVTGEDAERLFNNAIASWGAVVTIPIIKAEAATDANVIIQTTSGRAPALAEMGPPKPKGSPLHISFGSDVRWSARTLEAASCRMLGHVLGLYYTDVPGQLMTESISLTSMPLTPQEDDIRRVRAIWPD